LKIVIAAALALTSAGLLPTAAGAQVAGQVAAVPMLAGTRLDVNAVGEVSRIPDIAIISAGVATRSASASGAISENAARMERVRAALKRAGIADRDVQTSSISLNPEYRYQDNQPPQLVGYSASNQVNIRFRDIRNTGRILDALVAEGANQINGPTLTIDKPETAMDEARAKAVAAGRARAELYARSLGMRIVRLLSVSESGGQFTPRPMAMMRAEAGGAAADSKIDPGEQQLQVALEMSFELR
jgi:uncharacterized protein YggE